MRCAVFGDIHANIEALDAVLIDARSEMCTHHACVGDIVGYGADPAECVEVIQSLECPVVRGDLDEITGKIELPDGLNAAANKDFLRTRKQLSREQMTWLRDLPLISHIHGFTIVHANLDTPENWVYTTSKFDAMVSFSHQMNPVCFFGHTHVPQIFIKDDEVVVDQEHKIQVEAGKKYFINVGSVGQPRDGDWRACYAIYDLESATIVIKRVDYDLKSAQRKFVDTDLP